MFSSAYPANDNIQVISVVYCGLSHFGRFHHELDCLFVREE